MTHAANERPKLSLFSLDARTPKGRQLARKGAVGREESPRDSGTRERTKECVWHSGGGPLGEIARNERAGEAVAFAESGGRGNRRHPEADRANQTSAAEVPNRQLADRLVAAANGDVQWRRKLLLEAASAIEARSDATPQSGAAEGESATAESRDAQGEQP